MDTTQLRAVFNTSRRCRLCCWALDRRPIQTRFTIFNDFTIFTASKQLSHSSRDCQQARRWCSSRLRPGTCRAAPQRPARFPADRRAQRQIFDSQPAVYRLPTHGGERAGTARGGGDRGDGRRLEERGAARRGPRRPTIQQHHCAPPSRVSRTRTASRHPTLGAGRSPYQPHECQLAYPPPRGEGERSDLLRAPSSS